ncbi:hypothetical protein DXG03_007793 [Asterophora parasitica]|uniref:Uncharacterized protein n=1 Tax=Asterophora parasitica TaxID=117018 RepID=A0A9P7GE42_9AGAR|nr:hypothetical protein DXG03_007793 [Asterophora parasitica]
MDAWGIDVVITASQKGLGAPPGLSILIASQRAIKTFQTRKTPVTSYFASWKNTEPSLEERFRLHKQVSQRIKALADQLGLAQVPQDSTHAANGMTALYLPEGIVASDVLPRMAAKGVTVAGGLGDIKDKYIRIGHMGTSVVDASRGDIDTIANSLVASLNEAKEAKKAVVEETS